MLNTMTNDCLLALPQIVETPQHPLGLAKYNRSTAVKGYGDPGRCGVIRGIEIVPNIEGVPASDEWTLGET